VSPWPWHSVCCPPSREPACGNHPLIWTPSALAPSHRLGRNAASRWPIRHFGFMLRGLTEVDKSLRSRGVPMLLLKGQPQTELPKAIKTYGASHLVCDFSPLRIGREWREKVAEENSNVFIYEGRGHPVCADEERLQHADTFDRNKTKQTNKPVAQVDAHNVVPLWEVSEKQEYAARTIRPKIHKQVPSTPWSLFFWSLWSLCSTILSYTTIPEDYRFLNLKAQVFLSD